MSVRKEALYANAKALFQKPVKRVWFKLNPLLEKTSLFLQDDTGESKFTLPLKSVVICEKILEDDTAFQTGCTEVDFWEYLNSGRWTDWCTVRVFEGELMDWLIEGLHALQESGTIATCQTRVFTENIKMTRNPLKNSETRETTEISETLRLSFTYYGKRNEPIENMFSGSTAYPASTMSGPDFNDFTYSDVERLTSSDPNLAETETNADRGKDNEPLSADTEISREGSSGDGDKPDTATISEDITGNDRESTNRGKRVSLSSETDDSIRYWNNGTAFSQRYSRPSDSDSDLGYGKGVGLSILTPQRLPLNDNMPSPFTPYKQWAKLKEAARTSRNYSTDSSVIGERTFRLPSIYDFPRFMCSRIIRTPPDKEEGVKSITSEEDSVDPDVEESSQWLTGNMKQMSWDNERVVDRLRRRRTELAEERERNRVTGGKVALGQHLLEVDRIIADYEAKPMEFPILKRCHPVPTFEQFLLQLLDDADFDPRFRVNKRRVRKIAKRYNLKGDKNQAALVQAMKEEQGKCPPSLLEDLRIMFLPRYPRDPINRASKRSPRKKETQEKKKCKRVKGTHKEGTNMHLGGNAIHKGGGANHRGGKEPSHSHDRSKKTKAAAETASDAQQVESTRSMQSQNPDNGPGVNNDGQFVETVVGITDCPAFRHSLIGITENEEGSDATSATPQERNPSGPRGSPEITITFPGSSDQQLIQAPEENGRRTGHVSTDMSNKAQGAGHQGTPSGRRRGASSQGTPPERGQSSNSELSGAYTSTSDEGGRTPAHRKEGREVRSPKSTENGRLAVGGVRVVRSKKSGIASPRLTPEPGNDSNTEGGLAGNIRAKPRRHKGTRTGSGVFHSKSKQGSSRVNLSKGSSKKGESTANLLRGKSSVDTHRSSRPLDTAESIPAKGSDGTYDRDMEESPTGDYGIPELFDGSKINRRYSFERMRAKRKGDDRPNFKDILKKYMKVQKAVGVFKKNNAPKTKMAKLRGPGKAFQNPFQLPSPSPSPEQSGLKGFFGKALGKKRRMAVVPIAVVVPDFRHLGPTEFRRNLLKALEEYVVRKEQVVSSHKHRSITCITFTRSHIFL